MVGPEPQVVGATSPSSRTQVRRWLGKGVWAIADQGLFAISNFGLNVLLARWLPPVEYGAFTLAYAIFLLLGTFHTAVLTEPMLVFGPGKYRERLGPYLRVLLTGHWRFGVVTGALFGLAALLFWVLGNGPLTPALAGLAGASPFILFQWLMRRACYVKTQPELAAFAGAIYLVLIAVGAFILNARGWLGSATALGLMAVASYISASWLVRSLRVDPSQAARGAIGQEALALHWQYGRWAVGAAGLSWAAGNIPYLVLPARFGLEAVASLRAAFNFVMPVLQVFSALGSVILPALVQARAAGRLRRTTLTVLALYGGMALGYGAAMVLFVGPASGFVYGNNYPNLAPIALALAALPLPAAATSVLGGALRALERPRAVFWAYLSSTFASATLGVGLILTLGTIGAATSMALVSAMTASVCFLLLRRHLRGSAALGSESAVGA